MNANIPSEQPSPSAIEAILNEAVAHHRAGRMREAETLYRDILRTAPNHPEANHNIGVLAVQAQDPAAGLSYLLTALEANPTQRQYWLSYIDALIQAGQLEDARQVLDIAQQQGLPEDDVAAMTVNLNHARQEGQRLPAESQHDRTETKSGKSQAQKSGKEPTAKEMDTLLALFKSGQSEETIALAERMTRQFPAHLLGWQVLGIALSQLGRYEEALLPLQKTTALSPNDAKSHYNLGFVYQELGRFDEAQASYRQALKINPDYAHAHNNLAHIHRQLGRLDEAEASSRRALQLSPDFAEAHNNLGALLTELGRLDEAEASLRRALQLTPDYAVAHGNLGLALQKQNRKEEALACFQQQLQLMPENEVARYQIALLTGSGEPERAPDQYVKDVFDSYAHRFDTHLQQELRYDIPAKLAGLIGRSLPLGKQQDVLDLGCGTGLMGLAIAPHARTLVGVDLAAKMLEKAAARDLYQRLECADLLSMMRQEPSTSYDLIIAADVFVYVGKLDEIIRETKRLLRPGGYFAFSIEALNEPAASDYQLRNTGRYAHSAGYLSRLAATENFQIQAMEATPIRLELGQPVAGYMGLWRSIA
ncbi:MAG TPA: tetratricopeptide repeat protein [Sideroxyarcus sp.]|nr:tetratricopeptide repeat protein [Sideroxyarcus sp.]